MVLLSLAFGSALLGTYAQYKDEFISKIKAFSEDFQNEIEKEHQLQKYVNILGKQHNILLSHGTHSDINIHRFCSNVVDNRTSAARSLCHSPFWEMFHSSNGWFNNLATPHPQTIIQKNNKNSDASLSWQPWKIEIVPGFGIGGKKTLSNPSTSNASGITSSTTITATATPTRFTARNSVSIGPLRRGSIESNGFWKRSFIDTRLLCRLHTSNLDKNQSIDIKALISRENNLGDSELDIRLVNPLSRLHYLNVWTSLGVTEALNGTVNVEALVSVPGVRSGYMLHGSAFYLIQHLREASIQCWVPPIGDSDWSYAITMDYHTKHADPCFIAMKPDNNYPFLGISGFSSRGKWNLSFRPVTHIDKKESNKKIIDQHQKQDISISTEQKIGIELRGKAQRFIMNSSSTRILGDFHLSLVRNSIHDVYPSLRLLGEIQQNILSLNSSFKIGVHTHLISFVDMDNISREVLSKEWSCLKTGLHYSISLQSLPSVLSRFSVTGVLDLGGAHSIGITFC